MNITLNSYIPMRKLLVGLLFLSGLTVLSGCGGKEAEESRRGPTVFNVETGLKIITAESQILTLPVTCDYKWKATLSADENGTEAPEWAEIVVGEGNGNGEIQIRFSFNVVEQDRLVYLTAVSGSSRKSLRINQQKLSSVISASSVEFRSTDSFDLEIHAKQDWSITVPSDASWLEVSPLSGKAGSSHVSITPVDANENVGSRSAVLIFKIGGGEGMEIVVTQPQKNAIVLSQKEFTLNHKEHVISITVGSNVEVKEPFITTPSFIEFVSSKAPLNERQYTFRILPNNRDEDREGGIIFRDGNGLSEEVHILQKTSDPFLRNTYFGAYSIEGMDWLYTPGHDITLRRYETDGTLSFFIMNPTLPAVIKMAGLPVNPVVDGKCVVTFSYKQGTRTVVSERRINASVLEIDTEDGMVYLRGSDGTTGFIYKK